MKRILCPIDFSEPAANALAYAAEVTKSNDGELVIYHVRLMMNVENSPEVPSAATVEEIDEKLQELASNISKRYGIACYAELEPTMNTLASSISERTEACDLVIMGTNGADDLTHYFIGTNAYRAAVRSRTPFLIIPAKHHYTPISNVLYAFDYGAKQRLPLAQLKDWLKKEAGTATIIQVLDDVYDETRAQEIKVFEQSEIRKNSEIAKFETVFGTDIAETIHQHVIDNDFDALALCTAERTFVEGLFHKSVISELCARASYPVFVMHE